MGDALGASATEHQSDTLAPAEICGRNGVYQYFGHCVGGHDNGLRRIGSGRD